MLEKPSVQETKNCITRPCICILKKLGVNEAIIILHVVKI